MMKEIIEWIKTIVVSFAIAFAITLVITPLEVYSVSMNPTLVEHDQLILLNTKNVERGDIVSFKTDIPFTPEELKQLNIIQRFKQGDTKNLIKRVIAIPGDQLEIKEGRVYVNGKELEEDYLQEDYTIGDIEIDEIPENMIFVMGDNRNNSLDSRSLGLIEIDRIEGKALIRIFPFTKLGKIH